MRCQRLCMATLSVWVAETLLFTLLIRPPTHCRACKRAPMGGSICGSVLGQASLELTVYPGWSRVERWSSCLSFPSARRMACTTTLGLAFQQSCPCLSSHEAVGWAQRVEKYKLRLVWLQIFFLFPPRSLGYQ